MDGGTYTMADGSECKAPVGAPAVGGGDGTGAGGGAGGVGGGAGGVGGGAGGLPVSGNVTATTTSSAAVKPTTPATKPDGSTAAGARTIVSKEALGILVASALALAAAF